VYLSFINRTTVPFSYFLVPINLCINKHHPLVAERVVRVLVLLILLTRFLSQVVFLLHHCQKVAWLQSHFIESALAAYVLVKLPAILCGNGHPIGTHALLCVVSL
jgi:hypothetical protein